MLYVIAVPMRAYVCYIRILLYFFYPRLGATAVCIAMVRKRNPAAFSAREVEFTRGAVVVVVSVAVVVVVVVVLVVVGSSITSGSKEWRGSMKKKRDASKRRRSLRRTIYVFTTKSASNAQ